MIQTGEVLAGKYRIEQVLGKGGMGYIVSAIHTQLEERVAVKFMMPELCEHQEAVARFLREARAAARIRSEHVARVRDVGTLDDGTPYTVMEFLSGHDLATELEKVHHLEYTRAVDYVLQACEALAEAHSYGIIHRDLKPANLFLTQRADGSPLIKILDFGISKAVTTGAETSASLTASQSLIGSPHYMSPEQVRHPKMVDPRSDIWALGVILHELIVGDRPFSGDTPMSVLAAVVSDAPVRMREHRLETPPELEAVVLRCLEKDPARRFSNVAELARSLEPWATPASRPLVARIEGIVRTASGSTPPELKQLPTESRLDTSETLPSPRFPQATLPSTPPAPSSPGSQQPSSALPTPAASRRALWLWGAAVMGAIGGALYVLSQRADKLRVTEPVSSTGAARPEGMAFPGGSSLGPEPQVDLAPSMSGAPNSDPSAVLSSAASSVPPVSSAAGATSLEKGSRHSGTTRRARPPASVEAPPARDAAGDTSARTPSPPVPAKDILDERR